MNIQQMHESFRVIGQQMGMQLVRGILPESIDIFINNVIVEKTQIDLLNNVKTVLQDNVNMQGSTMSPINLFRTLYRNARFTLDIMTDDFDETNTYLDLIFKHNENNGYHKIILPTPNAKNYYENYFAELHDTPIEDVNFGLKDSGYYINPMLYLGFSVEYDDVSEGNATACRLIGADMLETTFRDYCNGASKKEPIVTMVSSPIIKDSMESSTGVANEYIELYTNTKGCIAKYLNIKYIKTPNVVKWDADITKCVNCDLPEYTHYEIVERAVRKFFASVGMGGEPDRRQQRD